MNALRLTLDVLRNITKYFCGFAIIICLLTYTARAQTCDFYPIALSIQTLSNAVPDDVVDIYNGTQPGSFGWLSWGGSPSEPTLLTSLTPPGNSPTYVNPDNSDDHQISVGNWVSSKPGVSNSKKVRDALDNLKTMDITVPVWDQARGSGDHAAYQVSGFAIVRILNYQLPQQNRITARFVGFTSCGQQNLAPTVDAGADQTITLPAGVTLAGVVSDDGLPAGSTLTVAWSVISGPGQVTFADGTSAATTADFSDPGTYVLRLTGLDSQLTSSDDVVITVNRENQSPMADSQSVTNIEDTAINIILTGSDPDGDPLTYVVVTPPAYGALSGTPPNVTYTPKQDYNGPDEFTFRVNDGLLDSGVATVIITNLPVNDAPVADARELTTDEDTPLIIALSGSDVEGSPLTYTILSQPTNGTLSGTAPNITYQPATNYHGPDGFTFQVSDGELSSVPALVSITVISVNDAPVVDAGVDQFVSLPTNSVTLVGTADDDWYFETNSLFTEWSAVSGLGTVTFGDATALTTSASFSEPGVYVLRLTASDWLLEDYDEVQIIVNARPVVDAGSDQTITYPAGATLNGFASDDGLPTNGTLTVNWSRVSGPGTAHFVAAQATNTTVSFSEGGIYVLRLTASDSAVEESDEVTITVNRSPIVDAGSDQMVTNLAVDITGTVVDDGIGQVTTTWSQISGPGMVTFSTNAPATMATFSQTGVYVLRLTADDTYAQVSDEVTISVNGAPVAAAGVDQIVNFPAPVTLSGTANDDGLPAGTMLSFAWSHVSGPGTTTFVDAGTANTTASFSESGVYVLRLSVSDSLLTSSDEVVITANLPPQVNAGEDQAINGLQVSLQGVVTDDGLPANGMLTTSWSKVSGPGNVAFSTNAATAVAIFDTSGDYVLRLTGDDGFATASDDVSVHANSAPVAQDQSVNAKEDTTVGITLQGTDADSNTLTYMVMTFPSHGSLNGVAPNLIYAPATNFNGIDAFTFQVNDGQTNSGLATVQIVVASVNDAPALAVPGSQSVDEEAVLVFDASRPISISDPDAGVGTLELSLQTESGTIRLGTTNDLTIETGADGASALIVRGTLAALNAALDGLSYIGNVDFYGEDTLTLVVNDLGNSGDGGSLTNSRTIAITVNIAGNHSPYIVSTPVTNAQAVYIGSLPKLADVSLWTPVQYEFNYQSDAIWSFSSNNTVAYQSVNSDSAILLGDFPLYNTRVQGSWTVLPSSPDPASLDDDFVGFVFGYQDSTHYYLFDWKKATQYYSDWKQAEAGMSVKIVSANSALTGYDLWPTYPTDTNRVRTIYHNTNAWEYSTNYQFTLDFHPGGFVITVQAGTNTLATIPINDTTYLTGRFGFYNQSQDSVRYTGFTYNQLMTYSYTYDVDATDLDGDELIYSLIIAPSNMTINAATGLIGWSPTTDQVGAADVTVQVTDGHGGTNLQSFQIQVPPAVINQTPYADAGPDQSVGSVGETVILGGSAVDDGVPTGTPLQVTWTNLSGPGQVVFADSSNAFTTATFSTNGIYVLQLEANDTIDSAMSLVEVRVGVPCSVKDPAGLTAWWPGNLTRTDVIGGSDAVLNGAMSYTNSGKVSAAFRFDGSDDYAFIPARTNLDIGQSSSGFTVEFWINSSDLNRNVSILSWHNGRTTGAATNAGVNIFHYFGRVFAQITDIAGNQHQFADVQLQSGVWHHVAVTYDRGSGMGRVYRDGIIQASANLGIFTPQTSYDLYLGKRPGEGVFKGMLDEISLYNRPLNPQEIYEVFASGSTGKCPVNSNEPPLVYAGPDLFVTGVPGVATLQGDVDDDDLPAGSTLRTQWSKFSGPGTVGFANSNAPVTSAMFSTNGIYVLQLTVDDGEVQVYDRVEVRVESLCSVEDPQGLAAWWPANGFTAEVLGGRTGTLVNGMTYTTGKVASAFFFDGANDYFQFPAWTNSNIGQSASGFTVEFWVNSGDLNRSVSLISWHNGLTSGAATNAGVNLFHYYGNVFAQITDTSGNLHQFNGSATLQAGVWHHVAVTYDRVTGVGRIYRDGVILASANLGIFTPQTSYDLYFGNRPGEGVFKGMLDEVSLYNRPLNPQEVYEVYTSGSTGKCPADSNEPPLVYAGPDLFVTGVPGVATLQGDVDDDGLPAGSTLRAQWSKFSGPGTVDFANSNALVTSAAFSTNGIYVLQLTVDDGEVQVYDRVEVRVESLCSVEDIQGLTAWWPANGTALDALGGQAGIFVNGASYSTGKVAAAFLFDGANDAMWLSARTNYDIGKSASGFTIEFWTRLDANASVTLLGWHNGTSGGVAFRNNNTYLNVELPETNGTAHTIGTSQTVFQTGVLQHIALTYNRANGQARVYVDGILRQTFSVGSFTPQTGYDLYFANRPSEGGYFKGILDEVSLYNRPLNPQEIYEVFASGSTGKCPLDSNEPPLVYAGPDLTIPAFTNPATLNGIVADDGLPLNSTVRAQWRQLGGASTVSFANSNAPVTTASFNTNGIYVLQLTADDGEALASDVASIRVGMPCVIQDPAGLSAFWPANGTAVDLLSSQPGLMAGGVGYTNARVATGFLFDGSNDYIQSSARTNLDIGKSASGFTIEFWTRLDANAGVTLLGWHNGTSGGVAFRNNNTFLNVDLPETNGTAHTIGTGQTVFQVGVLQHLALTYERTNGQAKVYVNGGLRQTFTVGNFTPQTSYDLYFGNVPGSGLFKGLLDEISLYTRPLATNEIQAIYNAGASGKCVTPLNQSPVVFAGADQTITLPVSTVTLNGVAFDDGLPVVNPLQTTWSYVAGPDTVFFSSTNTAITTVTFTNIGVYTFQLSASDGEYTTNDTVTVTVLPDPRIAPTVSLTSPAEGALVDRSAVLTLTANAADADGVVTGVEFFLNGVSAGVDTAAPFTIVTSNLPPGGYTVTAVATDDSGLSTTSAPPVNITVYQESGAPLVELFSPDDVTSVTAPASVIGTAYSPILQSYTVRYRFKAPEDATSAPWVTLATGNTSVVSNTLALFDPTLLLNGIYEIQLTATDYLGGTTSSEIQTLLVSRSLKVGHFTLSFSDLTVPLAGVPIEIIRTYDSRDQRTNDFGAGWSLDIRNVRLQKTRNLGANWNSSFVSPWYSLDSVKPRRITVTLAGDKAFEFESVLTPSQQFGYPIESTRMSFTNLPGTYGKLEIDGENQAHLDGYTGYINLINIEDFSYFNPTRFKFTTAEGDVYIIDEKEGLKSLADRNGNTLTITSNGVFHSSGVSVAFTRDAQGRISAITDPAGNQLHYAYTNGNLLSFTDRVTNTTTFAYTNTAFPHYLTEITDPRGVKAIRTEFDAGGRMIRQIDGAGNVIEFTHDLSNNREIIRDRLGNVTIHEYDERGNVVRTTDPINNVTTHRYDDFDNEIETVDALGNTNQFTYDASGNKLTETDPLGNTTRYTYGKYRELTSITNPRGFASTNLYDDNTGNLLEMRDALGNVTAFTYVGAGNLRTRADALGNVLTNAYDSQGRMTFTATLNAQLQTLNQTTFTYDTNGNQLTKSVQRTTPQGVATLVTRYGYDPENRLVRTIQPDGSSNTTVYAVGLDKPAVEIDPLGRQTLHYYDARGNETNTVFADLTSESTFYDAENRKLALLDRAGRTTFFTNDALGRLTVTVHPDGASEASYYDAVGRIAAKADARGYATFYGFDAAGRNTSVTNALGQVSRYEYDEAGNRTVMIDALGRTNRLVYDELDRRVQTIFADGSTQTTWFDALGRRTHEQDQAGKVTAFGYDGLGRLTSVTNALGYVTAYAYNELGQQISQTDANLHTTTFEYDSLGRRVKRTLPGNQVETYAYNIAGLLTNRTDFNGYAITFQYDSMNRLLAKVPDSRRSEPSVTFGYNALGLRTNMTDASGATAYAYDNRNRLLQKTKSFGGTSFTSSLNYSYDANGNLTNILSSDANGVNVGYEWDALNRLNAVNDANVGRTAYNYDDVGNLQSYTYPNGVNAFHEYDALNRLTNLASSKLLTPIASYTYTVGAAGNRLTAGEVVLPNGVPHTINRVYTYDDVYRLTGEAVSVGQASSLSQTYAYDAVGNRLTRNAALLPAQNLSFDANDRLNTDTYDANGNTLLAAGFSQYQPDLYDFENRLVSRVATVNGQATTINIWYDGDGNRVKKSVTTPTNSVTTFFVVDDLNPSGYAQVLEEHQSINYQPSTINCIYSYGHTLISQDRLNGATWVTSFYGYDGHNNVRYLTDNGGNVTDTYDYDAFGNLISATGNTENYHLFTGEEFDLDLRLYFLRARYHNPETGRFWTQDSYEGNGSDPASLHKYTYCHNNPINAFDPSGHKFLSELGASMAIGAVINVMATVAKPGFFNQTGAQQAADLGLAVAEGVGFSALGTPLGNLYAKLFGPELRAFAYLLQKPTIGAVTAGSSEIVDQLLDHIINKKPFTSEAVIGGAKRTVTATVAGFVIGGLTINVQTTKLVNSREVTTFYKGLPFPVQSFPSNLNATALAGLGAGDLINALITNWYPSLYGDGDSVGNQ